MGLHDHERMCRVKGVAKLAGAFTIPSGHAMLYGLMGDA